MAGDSPMRVYGEISTKSGAGPVGESRATTGLIMLRHGDIYVRHENIYSSHMTLIPGVDWLRDPRGARKTMLHIGDSTVEPEAIDKSRKRFHT